MDSFIKNSQQSIVSKFFTSIATFENVPNIRWRLVFIALLTNIVLPNLMLSYGTIILIKSDNGDNVLTLIVAPSIFVVVSLICDGMFREAAETWGSSLETDKLAAFGVFISFLGVFVCSLTKSTLLNCILYGIFCGAGSRLTLCQINYVLDEVFYTNMGVIQLLTSLGEVIGQIAMPYFIMLIFYTYGSNLGMLIVSCIVLQLLPFALFIKLKHSVQPRRSSDRDLRSRTYIMFGSSSSQTLDMDIALTDVSKKSWRSPSDENIHNTYAQEVEVHHHTISTEAILHEEKTKTVCGVEILPQILEESEKSESSEGESRKYNKSKELEENKQRYSRVIDDIDDFPSNDESDGPQDQISNVPVKRHSPNKDDIMSYDMMEQNISHDNIFDKRKPERTKKVFARPSCDGCCDSYDFYRLQRRLRNFVDALDENVWEPAILSLKTWQFYPAVAIRVCSVFVPLGVSSLLPMLGRNLFSDMPTNQVLFLLTVHALGWLLFLFGSPWIININKSKYKFFVIGGLLVSSVGLFMIMKLTKYLYLLISAFAVGLGQGAISLTYLDTLRSCIGTHKWSKIRDTIDRTTALIVFLLAVCMTNILKYYSISLCFGMFSTLHGAVGTLIAIVPFLGSIRKRHTAQVWPRA